MRGMTDAKRVQDAEVLLATAAYALSHFARHPAPFHGPACRPAWRFAAPEIRVNGADASADARSPAYAVGLTLLAASSPDFPDDFGNEVSALQWLLDDGPARAWRGHPEVPPPLREFLAACCAKSRQKRPKPAVWAGELQMLWPENGRFPFPRFPVSSRSLWETILKTAWAQMGELRVWMALAAVLAALGAILYFRR